MKRYAFQLTGFWEGRDTITYKVIEDNTSAQGGTGGAVDEETVNGGKSFEFVSRGSSTSLFAFGKAEGPLISLEFATITGLMIAFGNNIQLRWPEVEEIKDFPFVAMHRSRTDPAAQLKDLISPETGGWISPAAGHTWIAGGIKLDICLLVAVDTAAIVQWSPDIRIALIGVAVAELPSVESPVKFARIEIGFKATAVFAEGSLKFEGQISPDSFILHPSCHLRGGVALCL